MTAEEETTGGAASETETATATETETRGEVPAPPTAPTIPTPRKDLEGAVETEAETQYVLGVDLGTDNAVLTLTSTKTAKPDILRNDLSKQSTPICVAFNGLERSFGSLGLQLQTTHKDNTIRGALRAIGATAQQFKTLAPWCACRVTDDTTTTTTTTTTTEGEEGGDNPNPNVCFEVDYRGERCKLSAEQIYATLLKQLSSFADNVVGEGERYATCVTLPDGFSDAQRAQVKTAVAVSGLDVVRFVDRSAAVCLAYGSKKPEDVLDGTVTMLVDIGHGYASVAVYEWTKKTAKLLARKSSERLGSYAVDQAIFEQLQAECKDKYGQEVVAGSKGGIRLLKVCQKLKESLSAVPEADATCENLFDGQDVRFVFTRERLQTACGSYKDALLGLCKAVVEESTTPVTVCELVGGGMRIPFVKEIITDALNEDVPLSYTLDSMAAPATGASLAGVKLFEPKGGIRRPALENIATIADGVGLHEVAKIEPSAGAEALEKLCEIEKRMAANDVEVVELAAARNKLEAFVFETRSAARGGRKFGELIEKDACLGILDEFEEWMYTEEAEQATKSVYEIKLEELKRTLEPSCKAYLAKVEEDRVAQEKELEALSKKAAEELEASGGKDDHDFRKLAKPERMKKVMMNKQEGTSLFKDGNVEAASLRYKRALQHCEKFFDLSKADEEEVTGLKHTLHLNIAMCHIKLESWEFGLEAVNKAIELNDNSCKAYYRRALILEKKKDFHKAKKDLMQASALEPDDKGVKRLLERVNIQIKREKAKQKKMAQKMFG